MSTTNASEDSEIHFVTAVAILCGARLTEPWTVSEGRVTCDACCALLRARSREGRESVQRAVRVLTRIMQEE